MIEENRTEDDKKKKLRVKCTDKKVIDNVLEQRLKSG